MQIGKRLLKNVVVLDLKGKLTIGEGDELLKERINKVMELGSSQPAAEPRRCALCR